MISALEDSEQRAKQEMERKHDVTAQEPTEPHLGVSDSQTALIFDVI